MTNGDAIGRLDDAVGEFIPLVDLKAQLPQIEEQVRAGWDRVLKDATFIMGPELARFEKAFAAYCGSAHCIGVNSGTDALEIALRAVGVGIGDEVILPANTFVASAAAVARCGATPVLVDCDQTHLLIDVGQIAKATTERTKAIMPVHLYGQMAPLAPILDFANSRGIAVVEDAAQAHGARQGGHRAGSLGAASGFSFYPGKNLGAFGDGGAVVTPSAETAKLAAGLRNFGSHTKYEHPQLGFNTRLDPLQAIVLDVKLQRLDAWNQSRQAAAERYASLLDGIGSITLPQVAPENEHVWHLYVVRVPDRDRVLSALHDARIGASVHYPTPIHLHGAFAGLGHRSGAFPVAESASREVLSLPLFAEITAEQQERVARVLASQLD